MPALQSTYSERMPVGAAGMPADMSTYDADTLICESAAIGFGVAVSQGAAPRGALLGSTAAALFRGISVRSLTLDPFSQLAGVDRYVENNNMSVMFRGDIWVKVGILVVAGEPVTFISTTGVLGSWAADGTHFTIAGARWLTSQSSVNGLAVVRLAGPVPAQNMAS